MESLFVVEIVDVDSNEEGLSTTACRISSSSASSDGPVASAGSGILPIVVELS